MLGWGARRQRRGAAQRWHSLILRQAREPDLYASGLAQDTLEGRFQMVTLVSALVLRRLREAGADGRKLADSVYREVFSGFDHASREEGVGDASIARKMRRLGEEFFGLARALDQALSHADKQVAIVQVLIRNGVASDEKAQALAQWCLDLEGQLDQTGTKQLLVGQFCG